MALQLFSENPGCYSWAQHLWEREWHKDSKQMINIFRATGNWRQYGNVFLNCTISEELYCRWQYCEMGRTGSSQLTPILTSPWPHPHEDDKMMPVIDLAWYPRSPQLLLVNKLHDPFTGDPFQIYKPLIINFLDGGFWNDFKTTISYVSAIWMLKISTMAAFPLKILWTCSLITATIFTFLLSKQELELSIIVLISSGKLIIRVVFI